ncbi:MAG: transposase, partial [Planctomycetota bacterium]
MNDVEKLKRENETLRAKFRSLESKSTSLESANKSLTKAISQLESTNASLVGDAKSLVAANEELTESNGELKQALAKKQDELDALIRRFFGRQSERYEDGDQLKFSFANDDELDDVREGILQAIEENKQAGKNNKPPKRRDRKERFPESLPRKEVVIDLPEDEKEGLTWIGEDIVESAHYTGGSVHIVRKIFPKYVRKDDPKPGVLQAPRPPALIQGDRYDTSFAAAVIANRLGYHLPIYRQEDIFASCGLYLSRSTLLNLQENAARMLRPFASWLAN